MLNKNLNRQEVYNLIVKKNSEIENNIDDKTKRNTGSYYTNLELSIVIMEDLLKNVSKDYIENLDEKIIRPIVEGLEGSGEEFRMVILPDHPTPICTRTHSADPVPYLLYDSRNIQQNDWHYNEKEAEATSNRIEEGHLLIEYLLEM